MGLSVSGRGRFSRHEESLVAVVAMVLLIVVVIAVSAGAYYAFNSLVVDKGDVAIPVTFRVEQETDRLSVISVGPGADWSRIGLRLKQMNSGGFGLCVGDATDGSPLSFRNEAPQPPCLTGPNRMTVGGREVVAVSDSALKVQANEFLHFCGEAAASAVTVMVLDRHASTRLGDYVFTDIVQCA